MAQPTNTFDTYDGVNSIREDFADVIYNISPTDTPFLSNAGQSSANATLHEWQTDSLESATANAQKEGDDYDGDARSATTRLTNYTQISAKAVTVSGTEQSVNQAGKGDELAYQLAKIGKELKRDIEFSMVGQEQAKTAGSASVARTSASVGTWYGATATGNYSVNGTPSAEPDGDGTQAIAGGTGRSFTEALLKAGLLKSYELGGNPDVVLMSPANKQTASGFSGVATQYKDSSDMTVIGAVDVYVSDFGEVTFVPDRFAISSRIDILQMDMWDVAYLRPFQTTELSKTGDSEKRLLLAEWTLVAKSPNANYGIFNIS